MKIILDDWSFDLSEPHAEGHPLTAPQAQALNGLRADRIRELVRKRVARQRPTLAELQALVAQVDAEWEFQPMLASRSRLSRLEIEIAKVAEEDARTAFTRAGREPEGGEFEALVATLSASLLVHEEAQRRLDVSARVAEETLEDLLA